MFSSNTTQESGASSDPQFNYVTMLLPGNGTNGAQNNTFLDSSTNNFTITRNGNTTQGTFSPYGSNWSNFFDGTGDYLNLSNNAAFDFDGGDFTIECFFYLTGDSAVNTENQRSATLFCAFPDSNFQSSAANYNFNIIGDASTTGTAISFGGRQVGGSIYSLTYTQTITKNVWHHVAVVRSGSTLSIYYDGVLATSTTYSGNVVTGGYPLKVSGLYFDSGYPLRNHINGYISNLRVIKGSAAYSGSTYAVPSAPLTAVSGTSLLTCQANRFRDASSNNFAITRNGDVSVQRFSPFAPTTPYAAGTIGGSGYFGVTDYLSAADNAAFNFGSGDFTLEAFVYITTVSGRIQTIIGKGPDFDNGPSWVMRIEDGTGYLAFTRPGVASYASTLTVPLNQWNHVQISRVGTSFYIGVNGINQTVSGTYVDVTSALRIGFTTTTNSTGLAPPYISSVRILKGTALYTSSTYTVPTGPLTAITNTSLLVNFTNGGIIDNAMMNDLQTAGNAQISTSVSKFGTGSIAFDGNGDWLQIPNSQNFNFGSGNFTVEGWVYCTNTTPRQDIFTTPANGPGFNGLTFSIYGGFFDVTSCWASGSWQILFANAGAVSANTWHHFAVVRNGGTLTVYVNGTSTYSNNTLGTSSLVFGSDPATISYGRINQGDARYLYGYIDDFRVTKAARYTANFTPPAAPFPTN